MFLQDDKFPLPRRQSMFTFLKNAQIFSKFDLKSGFWQLGIEPSEHYKTAFCILNAHFQWTVLPFGLKTAPSIFQKSMVHIFQPILHHALIYIDDILLFSITWWTPPAVNPIIWYCPKSWNYAVCQEKHHCHGEHWIPWHDHKRWPLSARQTHCPRITSLSRSATFQKASSTVSRHHQLHQRLYPICGSLHSSPFSFIEKEAPRMECWPHKCCHYSQEDCAKSASFKVDY